MKPWHLTSNFRFLFLGVLLALCTPQAWADGGEALASLTMSSEAPAPSPELKAALEQVRAWVLEADKLHLGRSSSYSQRVFDHSMIIARGLGVFLLNYWGLTDFQSMNAVSAFQSAFAAGTLSSAQQWILPQMIQWQLHHGILKPFKDGAKARKAGIAEASLKEVFYQFVYYSIVRIVEILSGTGASHHLWWPLRSALVGAAMDGSVFLAFIKGTQNKEIEWAKRLAESPSENSTIQAEILNFAKKKKVLAAAFSIVGTFLAVMLMQENPHNIFKILPSIVGLVGVGSTLWAYRKDLAQGFSLLRKTTSIATKTCAAVLSNLVS